MTEEEHRALVVEIARSWLRTPYHNEARLKGAGVDCGQLLIAVYAEAGICPEFETGHYSFDWAQHNEDPRYLNFVRQYGREFEGPPLHGDAVLWKFGRAFSHGAIVEQWPNRIIHAVVGHGCLYGDADKEQLLNWIGKPTGVQKPRERLFFTPWGK